MRLGGAERGEDVFHTLRINPYSRIVNRNAHGPRRVRIGLDREDAEPVSDFTQRVQRIHHQVHQDLLHLNPVRSYREKIWSKSSLNGYLTPLGLSFGQRDDFSNHLIHAEPGFHRFSIFQKGANSSDNLARATSVTNYSLKRLATFVQVGRFIGQPVEGGLGIGYDGSQRLIYLVRDGCGSAVTFSLGRQHRSHRFRRSLTPNPVTRDPVISSPLVVPPT